MVDKMYITDMVLVTPEIGIYIPTSKFLAILQCVSPEIPEQQWEYGVAVSADARHDRLKWNVQTMCAWQRLDYENVYLLMRYCAYVKYHIR